MGKAHVPRNPTIARARRPAARELAVGDPEELALRSMLKNHHRGEASAIAKPRLYAALAAAGVLHDRRDLDKLLRAERAAGFPVAATGAGVFWAIRAEELDRARAYVTSRFADMRETVEAYDRLLAAWAAPAEIPGQPPRGANGQGLLFQGLAPGSRT